MQNELDSQGLLAERFEASSPRNTNLTKAIEENLISLPFVERETGKLLNSTDELLKGTLHCAISHLRLWKKISEFTFNENVLIFEDDVTLTHGFYNTISEHLDYLPNNYDIAFFGYSYFLGKPINKYFGVPKPVLPKRHWRANIWLSTYMVSTKGAKHIFEMLTPYNTTEGIDIKLKEAYQFLNVYFSLSKLSDQNRTVHGSVRVRMDRMSFL